MELKVFRRTLRRRWYLTLVVLALTIGATAYVAVTVGPRYEAEGSALVFPPASSAREGGETRAVGNPYLELAGVGQARDVVIRTMMSRTVQEQWGEDFPGMEYEATPDFTNSAPIILLAVEGGTSAGATAALDDLMARVPAILSNLQSGLALGRDDLVTARTLTQDAQPTVVRKSQIRAALLAAALAAGLGLLLLALADSLLIVRARSRAEQDRVRVARQDEVRGDVDEPDVPRDHDDREPATDTETETETENTTGPVYTYRVPVESEMAVSPARSTWQRSTPAGPPKDRRQPLDAPRSTLKRLNGSPYSDHGPHALIPPTRLRNVGRNR